MPESISTIPLFPSAAPIPATTPLGDWHGRGLCVGEDPDDFFPSNGDPGTAARRTCAACAVRPQCLDYAVEADEFGIWGGLDQQERRSLKRRRQRQAANRSRAIQTELTA